MHRQYTGMRALIIKSGFQNIMRLRTSRTQLGLAQDLGEAPSDEGKIEGSVLEGRLIDPENQCNMLRGE